jgi:hypothetical protein
LLACAAARLHEAERVARSGEQPAQLPHPLMPVPTLAKRLPLLRFML